MKGNLTYVVPLRRWQIDDIGGMGRYLRWLATSLGLEVVVVDGSAPEVFAAHHPSLPSPVVHIPVDSDLAGRYGKVNGVVTGLRAASQDRVVIADDDVRWDAEGLARMTALLDHADLVCPQNYFDPVPWHARWDGARSMLNRAGGIDFPGTMGVRRSVVLAAGGYDGDVLFENLELIRTVQAMGGRAVSAPDLFVRRLPPDTRHFWSQRVRQAYDDFALPVRLAAELALLPAAAAAVLGRRPRALGAGAAAAIVAAEAGRRRGGGRAVFPASCSLLAPAWLVERAVCIWVAVWLRAVRGGVPYAGTVLCKSANSPARLRASLGVRPEPEVRSPATARRAGPRRPGWAGRRPRRPALPPR